MLPIWVKYVCALELEVSDTDKKIKSLQKAKEQHMGVLFKVTYNTHEY